MNEKIKSINRRLRDDLSRSPSPKRSKISHDTQFDPQDQRDRSISPHSFDHGGPRGEKRYRNGDSREFGDHGRKSKQLSSMKETGSLKPNHKVRDSNTFHDEHFDKGPRAQDRSDSEYNPNRGYERDSRNGTRSPTAPLESSIRNDRGRSKVSFALNTKTESDDSTPSKVIEPAVETLSIEERRKRREAIKAKYKDQTKPLLVQALQTSSTPGTILADVTPARSDRSASPASGSTQTPEPVSAIGSPEMIDIVNDDELANPNAIARSEGQSPSAADYDPTMDMQEDRIRVPSQTEDDMDTEDYNELQTGVQDTLAPEPKQRPSQMKSNKQKSSEDMFASDDDEDDMFGNEPSAMATKPGSAQEAKSLDQSLLDNWDDPQGYYRVILGELLDGRYHVHANLGKGMFSGVIRATDKTTGRMVAIKIIRANQSMTKAGAKEMQILQKLCDADPDDKKHLIRLERSFTHKGHLCMVFENLSINLREVLKKFGRDVGINLKAVRSYAQQMFLGLSLLRRCNILHADLKPDNILVNETRTTLKLCDLGSAGDATEDADITQYLVSRFYRAPEIMLGVPYDFGIDMWSVGCTLFEMYTGKILFTGPTNNQMLKSMMECRGKFSYKMLKKGEFGGMHFNDDGTFRSLEKDRVTGKEVTKLLTFNKPIRDLKTRLLAAAGGGKGTKGLSEAEKKEIDQFANLLDQCLHLNPEKRITPQDALRHPFIHRVTAFPAPMKSKPTTKH